MEMTKIKGKEYAPVSERVKAFKETTGDRGSILTELVTLSVDEVVFKATVYVDGAAIATGYAWEQRTASNVNKTSYVENCETSAVGRALAFAGYGIDGSIASAEEVAFAITQQESAERSAEQAEAPKRQLDYSGLQEALEEWANMHAKDYTRVRDDAWHKLGKNHTQEEIDTLEAEYRADAFSIEDIEF